MAECGRSISEFFTKQGTIRRPLTRLRQQITLCLDAYINSWLKNLRAGWPRLPEGHISPSYGSISRVVKGTQLNNEPVKDGGHRNSTW